MEIEVKLEPGNICQGCLSADRQLTSWNDTDLLTCLIGHENSINSAAAVLLCWECLASIRTIRRFQERFRQAQTLLQSSAYHMSLSTLTYSETKIDYYINEDLNPDHYTNEEDDLEYITRPEDFLIIKQEHIDCKPIQFSRITKKKKSNVYRNRAKVTDNKELVVDELDAHYKIVYKTKDEMDEIVVSYNFVNNVKMRYACKVCKVGFKFEVDYRRHKTFFHPIEPGNGWYKCLECREYFETYLDLQEHWQHHNYVYQCRLCSLELRKRGHMISHLKSHTKIYTCLKCKAAFCTLKDFTHHYRSIHAYFTCDHCSTTFVKKQEILEHFKCYHSTAQCEVCHKIFKSYEKLADHYRIGHPVMLDDV